MARIEPASVRRWRTNPSRSPTDAGASLARAYPAPWRWRRSRPGRAQPREPAGDRRRRAAASRRALRRSRRCSRSLAASPRSRAPRPGCSSARSRRASRCASATLHVRGRGLRLEVPCASIAARRAVAPAAARPRRLRCACARAPRCVRGLEAAGSRAAARRARATRAASPPRATRCAIPSSSARMPGSARRARRWSPPARQVPGFGLLPTARALQRPPAHRLRRLARPVLPARASRAYLRDARRSTGRR